MLRVIKNLSNLSVEAFQPNYAHFQSVRWRRKPRWLPTAKSKVFRIPVKPVIPMDELLEMKRLNNNYNTTSRSVRKFLMQKYSLKFQESEDPEVQKKIFEDDFARCSELNDKWNAEQRVLREMRVKEEQEAELKMVRERIERELIKEEEKIQKIEKIVRTEKENAKTFVTAENLEQAIEYAINNPVDYNFAINLSGEKIFGRETKPKPVEAHEKVKVKQ